ncbi:RIP homotypic interaction motif-containing protein [Streptomyces fuscichromogenes]|uniref:RIP homotypic interaction motif-containing protein n=1 Tax=Streptomyces fuscichromogenes TaxID=1324013 RepID=UPI00382EA5D8
MNFAPVLRRAPVQKALAQLIRKPDDEALRAQVMKELGADRFSLLRADTVRLGSVERQRVQPPGSSASPHDNLLRLLREQDAEGLIMIRDCQGVQIGDHDVQANEFVYTCKRSQVNEWALLREHPQLAEALVDAVIGQVVPDKDDLRSQVDSALRATSFDPPAIGRISQANGVRSVTEADGVRYGHRSQATSTFEVTATVDARRLKRDIQHEADRLERLTAQTPGQIDGRADRHLTTTRTKRSSPSPAAESPQASDSSTWDYQSRPDASHQADIEPPDSDFSIGSF